MSSSLLMNCSWGWICSWFCFWSFEGWIPSIFTTSRISGLLLFFWSECPTPCCCTWSRNNPIWPTCAIYWSNTIHTNNFCNWGWKFPIAGPAWTPESTKIALKADVIASSIKMVCRLLTGYARDLSGWGNDFIASFGFVELGGGQGSSSCRSSIRDPRCGFAGNPTLFLLDFSTRLVLREVLLFPRGRVRLTPSSQPNCVLPPPYSCKQSYPVLRHTVRTKRSATIQGSTSEQGRIHFSKWQVCSLWAWSCRCTWAHFCRRVGTGHREGCGPTWQVWRNRGSPVLYLWHAGARACR